MCQKGVHWNLSMWRDVMFGYEAGFYLRQLDRWVKVWRRCGKRYADCCTDSVTAFGEGSVVMMWSTISLTWKTRLIITRDNLNVERYREEILQPVSVPYFQTGTELQDDNAHPTEWGFAETTSRILEYRVGNGLPAVLTSTLSNSCGVSFGVLFVPDWPTQPH